MVRLFVSYSSRFFSLLICLLVLGSSVSASDKQLVILNWEDYIAPEVIDGFKSETGITIKLVYYETDDHRDRMLTKSRAPYDLVMVSAADLSNLTKSGWIEKIDFSKIENAKHIRKKFLENIEHGVPYAWGSTGLAYRKDLVAEPITSLRQIFEPSDALKGKILMLDDARETVFSAAKFLGMKFSNIQPSDLKSIGEVLKKQASHVIYRGYAAGEKNELVNGEVHVSVFYNGDALLNKRDFNSNIEYVYPEEGCSLWTDYWTVSSESKNKDAAYQFLDYINRPEIAKYTTTYLEYASANASAEALLDESVKENRVIYPNAEDVKNCEFFGNPSPRVLRKINDVYFNIKKNREK